MTRLMLIRVAACDLAGAAASYCSPSGFESSWQPSLWWLSVGSAAISLAGLAAYRLAHAQPEVFEV